MKAMCGFGWLCRLLPVAGVLLLPFPSRAASETPATGSYSTNALDKAACEHRLNFIHAALQKYRSQHGDQFPAKLSDLVPTFIHDPNVLICPFVQKRGGLRTWKKQFREQSPDAYTSYGYEFAPNPVGYNHWRGLPTKTWQDYKRREAEELGSVVPIVRCHDHRPWLNLAINGRIYESGLYWEKNFALDDRLLSVAKLFAGPAPLRPLTAADFPPRDSRAKAELIDLTEFYNAALTNSWQGFPGNHLSSLPSGIQEFGGARFDIRGVIQLHGEDIPAQFPERVEGIPVKQKCTRVHFLHAAGFVYKPGTPDGFYAIHYSDGQIQEIPLVQDHQISDWWRDPQQTDVPTDAKVVWTGVNEAAKAYDKVLALYHFTWDNPRKDTPISTISFDSGVKAHAPFLVAITLE